MQPIILIGMHRSGTSLLVTLLEQLGVFMGARKDRNGESHLFQALNIWLMKQAGASWDVPEPTEYLLHNERMLAVAEEYLRGLLDGPRSVQFLGWPRYLKYRGVMALDIPWGWKDPRTTYTLPLWRRLFPDAKIINIERHGVDVAQSLKVRQDREFEDRVNQFHAHRAAYSVYSKKSGFSRSLRCATLEGAFSLWETYVRHARDIMKALPAGQGLSLTFEDLVENGQSQLTRLVEFCGLAVADDAVDRALTCIRPGRSYAYRATPALQAFADGVAGRLMGYDA